MVVLPRKCLLQQRLCDQVFALVPQTSFHPPLSTGANKPGKHPNCKPHHYFSSLLGVFPSHLSASPLLSGVSIRHFLSLHIPCLPAAGWASPQLLLHDLAHLPVHDPPANQKSFEDVGLTDTTVSPIQSSQDMNWKRTKKQKMSIKNCKIKPCNLGASKMNETSQMFSTVPQI